ncbi:MAG: CRISPR-associated endonuclease Cas6 [Rhodocyclaceae bacterium]|nr:type I-MYXAN CRISPR-associated protein Cas6/Cmx6 [Zoogloeaceae bacterium]MBV6409222.1 CRISPR-associated endonuclease Cas6 [Rhodocyclaceae bacterium]MCK6385179.1 type I-MYXAN CRISPR-associated protein Cas6/Cmx6 [Rhodocyclaceae bacterium]CAG0934743.1 CRISPR-associated endonuclease Cas6 [Rhodocyclaceae bacterium]
MTIVDVSFEVRCERLPRDHGYALYEALAGALDWLEDEASAGVHPLHGCTTSDGALLLGPRARLMLRLVEARAEQALALAGRRLDVGSGLEIGPGKRRELMPYATVYSHFVSTGSEDEAEFLGQAAAELREAGLPERMISGRAHSAGTPEGELRGFSLLLHGLSPAQSLAVQARGLGRGRKLGCGIFVPHKSVVAVGAAE